MDMSSAYRVQLQNGGAAAEAAAWLWAQAGHRLWATMPEQFWVYVYKVRRCPQPGSHDWTCCPYAHKGERARRRDPRLHNYLAVSCPDHSKNNGNNSNGGGSGSCARGLRCKYAHGVFELWLHPGRFRTRMCEAGARCPRRICFFAHFPSQLRDAGSTDSAASSDSVVPFLTPPRILQRSVPSSSSPAPAVNNALAAAAARDDGNKFDLQDVANRMRLLALCSANANNGGGGGISAFSAAPTPELVMVAPPTLHGSGGGGISVFSAAAPTPELLMVASREAGGSARGGCRSPEDEDEEDDSASTDSGGGGDDQYPHVDLINDLVD